MGLKVWGVSNRDLRMATGPVWGTGFRVWVQGIMYFLRRRGGEGLQRLGCCCATKLRYGLFEVGRLHRRTPMHDHIGVAWAGKR